MRVVGVGACPAPVRATVIEPEAAFEGTFRVAETFPAAVGANCTAMVQLSPAATV